MATCILIAGSVGWPKAHAVGSDTRTISLHHVHTSEDLTITYKKNGEYDQDALKKINWIMRDWRKNEAITMDPQEIDLLWEVQHEVGAKEAIYIICGYRSPDTNNMLRRRSKGVARFSQHTLGKAIDFYIPGVPLDVLRATAMRLQGGGVGFYPTSGSPFVHLDIGNVRAWPRMTREQLVKLFPDGRTVHLPTDGTPLPGYQLALADIERGHRTAAPVQKRSLLARLLNRDKDAEEVDDASSAREAAAAPRSVTAKPAPAAPAPAAPSRVVLAAAAEPPAAEAAPAAPVPLPPKRPIYQIAAAEPAPAPKPAAPINLASLSPTEIINMRGLWDGITEPAIQAALSADDGAAEISSARRTLAASLTRALRRDATTASIGAFASLDRVAPEIALAYAAPEAAEKFSDRAPTAIVSTTGSGSVARKPIDSVSNSRLTRAEDRLNDPWLRGVMLTDSMQSSLVVTRVGDPDFTRLVQYMQKPASAVMMTFSNDPHLGMTTEAFSGSAVVFQATVTFGQTPRRTAALQ